MRIGSIVIHCHEFDRMVEFWRNVLNYVPREPAADGWIVLRDPNGRGPNLSFQAREKKRKSKKQQNRESAISRKQPLLFSSKQWESSSLGRATRRSVILAQVGVDNVILVKPSLGL